MAIRDVIKVPNPMLAQKSEEVKIIDKSIKKLVKDMFETMKKNNGIGLAAVQIGVLKRIIVIEIEQEDIKTELINPKILSYSSSKSTMEEGCLSVPNGYYDVERPNEIVVEFTNLKNKVQKIEASGLFARCIQHEIDHLNGITIVDKGNLAASSESNHG